MTKISGEQNGILAYYETESDKILAREVKDSQDIQFLKDFRKKILDDLSRGNKDEYVELAIWILDAYPEFARKVYKKRAKEKSIDTLFDSAPSLVKKEKTKIITKLKNAELSQLSAELDKSILALSSLNKNNSAKLIRSFIKAKIKRQGKGTKEATDETGQLISFLYTFEDEYQNKILDYLS